MEKKYFITAIDTDAGKTVATGLMAAWLKEKGRKVITMKMAQTGCEGLSEDILEHRRIMGAELFPEDTEGLTCPYVFPFPAAPQLSAELAGTIVDFGEIDRCGKVLADSYDMVLTEGVGGLMVPLSRKLTVLDYLERYPQPVLVVSGDRLGSINHTLLTLEVCRSRGIRVAGIIYNRYHGTDPTITVHTEVYLREHISSVYPEAGFAVCDRWEPGGDLPDFSAIFR